MGEQIGNYLASSGIVTYIVLLWLSTYFILSVWIFVYRYFVLSALIGQERATLESLVEGVRKIPRSALLGYALRKRRVGMSRETLEVGKQRATSRATLGLTMLAVVASTSPFIGLFGTVVEILDAFSKLGEGARATLEVIAPVISKALVATATGILTAIPAYSFHLLLKRSAFELATILQMQIEMIVAGEHVDVEQGS
ncbi:MAG: MotA/TolQ/ExbB proton channel family protein [Helicobacter sp.]|nr:MotA/TolQ/ExbB proton channel family protein [Helicobacter sp.]